VLSRKCEAPNRDIIRIQIIVVLAGNIIANTTMVSKSDLGLRGIYG
jgi:hypothetical protein